MKKILINTLALVFIAAIVSVTAVAQDPAPQQSVPERWQPFSPAGGGFSVLMPGKVTSQDQKVESAQGERTNHVHYSDLGGDVFMVTYMHLPDPITDPASIKIMLDTGRDRGLESSKGKLERETEITLDGYSGREWLITLPKDLKVKAKAYWVSRTLYQVLVIMDAVKTPEAARATDERMEKFFKSFTLSKTVALN